MLCKYVWDSDTSMVVHVQGAQLVKSVAVNSGVVISTFSEGGINETPESVAFPEARLLATGASMQPKPLALCGVHNWQPSWSPDSNPQADQGKPCPSRKTETLAQKRSTRASTQKRTARKQ